MIRFLIALCIIAVMAIPAEAQLFRRSIAVTNCPGGVCQTAPVQSYLAPAPAMTVLRSAIPQWQYQPQVRVQTLAPVQSRVVLSPVRSIFTPVITTRVVSVPVVSGTVIQPQSVMMGSFEGQWRDMAAARMILTRAAMRGDANARSIRDNPEQLAAFVEALQVEQSAVGANGEFLKWLIQWAADNPDKVKILIDLITSLFA